LHKKKVKIKRKRTPNFRDNEKKKKEKKTQLCHKFLLTRKTLTEMISNAKKFFLDIVTKQFSYRKNFFSWKKSFFLTARKKYCANKKSCDKKKKCFVTKKNLGVRKHFYFLKTFEWNSLVYNKKLTMPKLSSGWVFDFTEWFTLEILKRVGVLRARIVLIEVIHKQVPVDFSYKVSVSRVSLGEWEGAL